MTHWFCSNLYKLCSVNALQAFYRSVCECTVVSTSILIYAPLSSCRRIWRSSVLSLSWLALPTTCLWPCGCQFPPEKRSLRLSAWVFSFNQNKYCHGRPTQKTEEIHSCQVYRVARKWWAKKKNNIELKKNAVLPQGWRHSDLDLVSRKKWLQHQRSDVDPAGGKSGGCSTPRVTTHVHTHRQTFLTHGLASQRFFPPAPVNQSSESFHVAELHTLLSSHLV